MTLQSLLERVESASGADRELDALIACHFFHPKLRPARPDDHAGTGLAATPGYIWTSTGFLLADRYTSSLDATLALVERVLPGWGWDIVYRPAHNTLSACVIRSDRPAMPIVAPGRTPALALLAAMLRAKIGEGE